MTAGPTLPLETSLVATALAERLQAKRDAAGPRPTSDGTRGRGSTAQSCARKIALDLHRPTEWTPTYTQHIAFMVGQDVHDRIQETMRVDFNARAEVPVSYKPKFDLSGNVDLVYDFHPITGETRTNLVTGEIKSMRQYAWDKAVGVSYGRPKITDDVGPKLEHVTQAALYGCAPQLESSYLHMIYFGKDTGQIAEWLIGMDEEMPHLDGRTPRQLAEKELVRQQKIFDGLDAGRLPARSIPGFGRVEEISDDPKKNHWACNFCNHQAVCRRLGVESCSTEDVEAALAADGNENQETDLW